MGEKEKKNRNGLGIEIGKVQRIVIGKEKGTEKGKGQGIENKKDRVKRMIMDKEYM